MFVKLSAKLPVLSDFQLDKLADVFVNVGTLFFGSGVVPYLIPTIDKPLLSVFILGLVSSLISWGFALWSVQGRRL